MLSPAKKRVLGNRGLFSHSIQLGGSRLRKHCSMKCKSFDDIISLFVRRIGCRSDSRCGHPKDDAGIWKLGTPKICRC